MVDTWERWSLTHSVALSMSKRGSNCGLLDANFSKFCSVPQDCNFGGRLSGVFKSIDRRSRTFTGVELLGVWGSIEGKT